MYRQRSDIRPQNFTIGIQMWRLGSGHIVRAHRTLRKNSSLTISVHSSSFSSHPCTIAPARAGARKSVQASEFRIKSDLDVWPKPAQQLLGSGNSRSNPVLKVATLGSDIALMAATGQFYCKPPVRVPATRFFRPAVPPPDPSKDGSSPTSNSDFE